MNGFTDALSKSYTVCYMNNTCINHILYAYYVCILAPAVTAMHTLLDVCHIIILQIIFDLILCSLLSVNWIKMSKTCLEKCNLYMHVVIDLLFGRKKYFIQRLKTVQTRLFKY